MTDTELRAAVVAERRDQVDLLTGLTPGQWDQPTLCAGWRVREVIAHTTMPYRTSAPRLILEMVKARGDVNRMADRTARRDAERMSAAELLAALRDNVAHPWTPPGGGTVGALSHDVIHGLDITVGLGLDRLVPPERVGLVLSGIKPKNIAFFGVDLDGVELRATDLDWTYGAGEPLRGSAQDLLLVICGRRLPDGLLDGAPAARFSGDAAIDGARDDR
jgi:uncharacterized protein (TIGR03083 family)